MTILPKPTVTRNQFRVAQANALLMEIAAEICSGCQHGYPRVGSEHDDHGERDDCTAFAFWDAVERVRRKGD